MGDKMDFYKTYIVLSALILLSACGDGSDEFPFPLPTPDPTPQPTMAPTPEPSPIPMENPICEGEMSARDGGGGFLWKKSDTRGTLVVLLPGRFQVEFDTVQAQLKTGEWVDLFPTGFANPEANGMLRQHWRSNFRVEEFKNNSLLIATEPGNTCAWRIGRANRRND